MQSCIKLYKESLKEKKWNGKENQKIMEPI